MRGSPRTRRARLIGLASAVTVTADVLPPRVSG